MKREAISYGRFSSNQQEEGVSTSRQKESFERVCQRYSDRVEPSKRFEFGHFFGKGESGFSGEHLEEGGSLAKFLALLENGTIDPKKTVLVIEMWSRFGRLAPDLATNLLSRIVRSGCVVAVCSPDMWVTVADMSSPQFVIISMLLQQAHWESSEKSRLGKVNRQRIRDTGLTKKGKRIASCPTWLKVEPTTPTGYVFLDPFASKLKEACLMSIAGKGQKEIGRKLGLPTTGLASYFRNRALIGEFQPTERTGKSERKAVGQVKEGYYPALLTENEFIRLQSSLDSRRHGRKKEGKVNNIFRGLVFNSHGLKLVSSQSRGNVTLQPYIKGQGRVNGKSCLYSVVESALLDTFIKLDKEDLYPTDMAAEQNRLREVVASINDLEKRIGSLQAKYLTSPDTSEIEDLIIMASNRKKALIAEMKELEAKLTIAKSDVVQESKELIENIMKTFEGDKLTDFRKRLEGCIARIVSRIELDIQDMRTVGIKLTLVNGRTIQGDTAKREGIQVSVAA